MVHHLRMGGAARIPGRARAVPLGSKTAMSQEFKVERHKITRPPVHPGVFFERNILPEFRRQRRSVAEIATLLGISRQTLHRVMAGRSAITAYMAVRLGKLCGNGPDLW